MPNDTVQFAESKEAGARGVAVPLSDRHLAVLYFRDDRFDGLAVADAERDSGLVLISAPEALRLHHALNKVQLYERKRAAG